MNINFAFACMIVVSFTIALVHAWPTGREASRCARSR